MGDRVIEGASIVVAGTTGGIGRPFARQLAERGARLTLTARDAGALDALGLDATVVAADIRDSRAGDGIIEAALTAADRALTRELRAAGITVTDARPPHTETGLASRPIAGTAPRLRPGLEPDAVAARIIAGIEAGEREIAADAFGT